MTTTHRIIENFTIWFKNNTTISDGVLHFNNLGASPFAYNPNVVGVSNKYFKITLGSSMLLIEGAIVVIGAVIFGFMNFMYAVLILYLITFLVDKVVLGISDKKAFYNKVASLNKHVEKTTGVEKLFDFVDKKLWFNAKYVELPL